MTSNPQDQTMSHSETHSCCNARLQAEGGEARCCYCVPHEGCKKDSPISAGPGSPSAESIKVELSGNIGKGKHMLIDPEDYDRVTKYKWYFDPDGSAKANYRDSGTQITVVASRLIMNAQKGQIVDHINGNKLDNRKANLRFATKQQNRANGGPMNRNKSGFRGVSLGNKMKRWRAEIKVGDKNIHLGYFDTPEEAAKAWDEAALEHHGEFARLNFPQTDAVTVGLFIGTAEAPAPSTNEIRRIVRKWDKIKYPAGSNGKYEQNQMIREFADLLAQAEQRGYRAALDKAHRAHDAEVDNATDEWADDELERLDAQQKGTPDGK